MIISWLEDMLRSIVFFLDKIVYRLIELIYNLFLEIANTTIFTNEMIEQFAGKVKAIVGIFMLFKVSFSILTYIVNPDEFTDKNKGMSKMVSNIVTSLFMLILVPFIFNEAMDVQRIILKDDIIPRIFSTEGINISSQDSRQGSNMSLYAFSAFCYRDGVNFNNLDELLNISINKKDDSDEYYFTYTPIISTVVGVVIILLLVSFCFDVAVRSVKLGFLRLMAPIPIIARVDPKKGNELFNKWVKNCTSTYLDLFMRLIAIFFAIYIINAMQGSQFTDAVTGDKYSPGAFTKVFIILGVLMFAKQLPKLLEDLLGIKLDGGKFSLNPVKKLRDVPLTSAAVGGLAGGFASAVGGVQAHRDLGHGFWKTAGGALAGFGTGMFRGGNAGLHDDGKGQYLKSSFDAARKGPQNVYGKDGTTFFGRNLASLQQTIGADTEADALDKEIKALEEYAGYKKQLKELADFTATDLSKNAAITAITTGKGGTAALQTASTKGAKGLKQYLEDLQNSGTATSDEITAARSAWEEAQKIAITTGNAQIDAVKAKAARFVQANSDVFTSFTDTKGISRNYSTNPHATYDDINEAVINSQNRITTTKASDTYSSAHANKDYRGKKK